MSEEIAPAPTEYVYLIGSEGCAVVKIGRSTDVPTRLAAIQYMSPLKLAVLWQAKGGAELEADLHRHFRAQRSHGEWFDFPEGDAPARVAQAIAEIATEKLRRKVERRAAAKTRKLQKVWKTPKALNQHLSTLTQQVAGKVRQLIVVGELQPGMQVPTEEALSWRFDVSRNTARQALQMLERDGLIRSRGGRGGRVVRETRSLPWNVLEEPDDLWALGVKGEVVKASEQEAAQLGVRPGDPVIVRRQMVMLGGKMREIADYKVPRMSRS